MVDKGRDQPLDMVRPPLSFFVALRSMVAAVSFHARVNASPSKPLLLLSSITAAGGVVNLNMDDGAALAVVDDDDAGGVEEP